jgi:hypothetical protein
MTFFRTQRFDFLANFFKQRRTKRAKPEKTKRVRVKEKRWFYQLPNGMSGTEIGFTRSHARAEIKDTHGLNRVPVGTEILCLGEA